jgi:hypothetical protein
MVEVISKAIYAAVTELLACHEIHEDFVINYTDRTNLHLMNKDIVRNSKVSGRGNPVLCI